MKLGCFILLLFIYITARTTKIINIRYTTTIILTCEFVIFFHYKQFLETRCITLVYLILIIKKNKKESII